jgi:5'-deoxynucleotidase YfbR-like HD superfamily hydrolase
MTQACIETYSGQMFDILDPQPETIVIEDIAHALSQNCRFTGHTKYVYTVGQHSLLASYLVPDEYRLEALMHDASEAYVADLSRPLKHFTPVGPVYFPIEENIMQAIACKFKFNWPMSEAVKRADNLMLYAEKAALLSPMEWPTKWGDSEDAAQIAIIEMSSRAVEKWFLERFNKLTKQ